MVRALGRTAGNRHAGDGEGMARVVSRLHPSPIRRVGGLGCLLIALLVAPGCGKKTQECERLIGTVNDALREIDARPQVNGDDLAKVARDRRLLAEKYRALAGRVEKLEFTEPGLEGRAKTYARLAVAASNVLNQGAEALDERNRERVEQSREAFRQVTVKEADLVREINGLCLPPDEPAVAASAKR